MATLTNTKIKDTYDGLLKTTDNEALDVSGTTLIEDGLGNASALSVGRVGNGVTVNGLLDVTGEVQGTSLDINGAADISGNLAVDTNTLYVDAASNEVGIGTSSPAANLEVSGNATRLMINTANSAQTVGLLFGLSQSSVASVFSDVSEQNLTFNTGGSSEAMRIDSSGRVSINDTVSGSVATNYNPELLVGGNIVARSLTANAALIEIGGDANSAFITAGKQDGSQTARTLRFEVGTSEKVRITGDGLTFNGDIAAANALDDYEEGTWTPQPQRLTGGDITATYDDRQGYYTKVGNMVTCSFYIGISSVSSQGSNLTRIAGLPFVPASNYVDVGVIGNNTSFDTIDVVSFLAHTQGVFYFRESGNTITNVNVDWVGSSSVSGTITYRV